MPSDAGFHDDTTATLAAFTQAVRREDIPTSATRALTWAPPRLRRLRRRRARRRPGAGHARPRRETATARGASAITVAGHVSPEWAVYANTTAVRYLDFNDNYFRMGGGHTSDIIPALWAAAEVAGAGAGDLLAGLYVGYETHMALADEVNLRDRGWDYPAFISIAAAAGTARVLGLTHDQTAHAISMTVTSATTPLGVTRVGSLGNWKALASAHACAAGFTAARLAQRGVTGPSRAIEGHRGMWALVTGEFSLDRLGEPKDGYGAAERSAYKLHVFRSRPRSSSSSGSGLHREGLQADGSTPCASRCRGSRGASAAAARTTTRRSGAPQNKEHADHSIPYVAAVALVDGFVQTFGYRPEPAASTRRCARSWRRSR